MRKITVFILVLSFFLPTLAQQRKKVGVVLSGGSAKGFAHIGVLKVLEEAGIPIDFITGTSMGALVGGLYSIGYSANQLDSLVKKQDWSYLMSDDVHRSDIFIEKREDTYQYLLSLPYQIKIKEKRGNLDLPPGVILGQNIYNLLLSLTVGYHDKLNFKNLPIPFGCIAADTHTGKEIVFTKGILPQAMRASMSIPGAFAPVHVDSMLLIDGGIINNYPVDLAKAMGADVVIGVIFPQDKRAVEKSRGTINEVLYELRLFLGAKKWEKNIDETNVLITPTLYPYTGMNFDFPANDSIIQRGEKAARAKWDELMALKKSIGVITPQNNPQKKINPYILMDTFQIKNVRIEGISDKNEKQILRKLKIKKFLTRKDLRRLTSSIYGMGFFSRVYYRFDGKPPFDLIFTVEENPSNILNIGARFDTNENASLLLNTTIRLNSSLNSLLNLTSRLSFNPYIKVDYSINNSLFYKGGISYKLSRNNINIYDRGYLAYNVDFTKNELTLTFSEFYFYNLKLNFGINAEYFHFNSFLQNTPNAHSPKYSSENKLYINYFLKGIYDNLDRSYFPTSGQYFSFRFGMMTDNFLQMNGSLPLKSFFFKFNKPIKISDNLVLSSQIIGRSVYGGSIPLVYKNMVGGKFFGYHVPQQIPIEGSRGMEFMKDNVLSAQTSIRFKLGTKNYLYTNINYTIEKNNLINIFKGNSYWGCNLGYSYDTVMGPLILELGYSSLSKRVHPFFGFGYSF